MMLRTTLLASIFALCASAASAGVSFDQSTASALSIGIGETVTIDVLMRSDGTAVFGMGAAVEGYGDSGVLGFTSGQSVASFFCETIIPSAGAFNCLDNLSGGALAENTASCSGGTAGSCVQFANAASLTGRTGTGAGDPGIGGTDGVHAQLVFTGLQAGTATVTVGTNPAIGNVIVLAGGATEPATANASFTITVPEPASVASSLAALGTVATLVGVRRRVA